MAVVAMKTTFAMALLAAALAPAANALENWPRWRGPMDNGMARGDAPLAWSAAQGIAWKAAVPGRGHSTPVVWGDRIFLTTAVPTGKPAPAAAPVEDVGGGGRRRGPGGGGGPQAEHRLVVMAFDRKTGRQLWEKTARTVVPHEGFHRQYGSFASNSPVVDGEHVIASFGSNGVYCYTHDGRLVWEKDLGIKMRMLLSFGEGSAPALDGSTLVLLYDHEDESLLVALDKSTGKELWRTPRPPGSAWSTPLIATVDGKKQAIVPATKFAGGYDLATGKLIWQATGLGRNAIPQPVAADGAVYVMTGFQQPNLMAIRLGREGNLTGTDAILWQNQRGNSYTPSPVLHDGKLYLLTDSGMLSCLDAKTGKPYYAQERLPKTYSFKASPVAANGKLYLATEDGDVVIVKMGEKFEVLATNSLPDEMFIASPAILDGEIYLRGRNTLYCIR
jgi:outer membrane protein assembly factor BamB